MLKEGWNYDQEGEEHSISIENDLENRFVKGEIDKDTLENALVYVSNHDYDLYSDNLDADYVLQQVAKGMKEGNAFTAALAKTKKGEKVKVDGEEITDTSDYDDPSEGKKPHRSVTGRGIRESHPENERWYEDFEDGLRNLANNKYISQFEYNYYMKALDHVDPMLNYGNMMGHDAAKEFVDDIRTKDQMDADEEQWSKEMGEGLHMPPLQATGQTIDTVEENSIIDAPFGVAHPGTKKQLEGPGLQLSNLTTDERKQLGEFVDAIKTTKKAIEELLKKASGKDVKVKEDMGGNRTDLVMTPNTMSEDIEGMVDPKFHNVFEKLIKALKAEGLDDMDIQMFIRHEMEKIGQEAVMSQHDLEEKSYKVSKNAVPAHTLKKGDIITSGEEVVSVSAGAKTPSGKVDVILKNVTTGKERGAQWGKHTMITKKPK